MVYLESFDGQKIWYQVFEGKEPSLIFIHGYANNSSVWKKQIKFFKDNKRIILDLRGHGKSSNQAANDLEISVKDINTILVKEKLKKTILVGHSLGGAITLMFQKMFPEKVNKMVLINPYVKRKQLTLKSRFLFKLLSLLFFYPRFNFDHSKQSLFPALKCVFSTTIHTLKFGKKKYFRDYNLSLPDKVLVINSSQDSIIKPYFKEGIFLKGKHLIQINKSEKVNELIKNFL